MQTPVPISPASFSIDALTGFDWFLLIILLFSTIRALQRGFIKVVLSLGGFIVGFIVASWNYVPFARIAGQWISNYETAEIVAFLVVLILTVVVFGMVANAMRNTATRIGLGPVDRLLGAGIGLIRGILIGVAVLTAIAAFAPNATLVQNSQLTPYFLAGAHAVSFILPDHFDEQIASGTKHLLQQTPELFRPHTLTQHMDPHP